MKRVGYFALATYVAYHGAEYLTLVFCETRDWWENREEKSLRSVLAGVREAHSVRNEWQRPVGLSRA